MAHIRAFVIKYQDQFNLESLSSEYRKQLVDSIVAVLAKKSASSNSMQLVEALSAVRILSRDKHHIDAWLNEDLFNLLMRHSGLDDYMEAGSVVLLPDNTDTNVVIEAMKCFCNLTFNSTKVQTMCAERRCVLALVQRAKTYDDELVHHAIKFYDMRLMFVITALVKDTRSQATMEWNGIPVLSDLLHQIISSQQPLQEPPCDVAMEVLKTIYNLTLVISPWRPELSPLESDLSQLVERVQRLICVKCTIKEKHLEIVKHCSNLFTTLPGLVADSLIPEHLPSESTSIVSRSFQGYDVSAIVEILRYLETVLEDSAISSQREKILPVVATLKMLSRSNRVIRKYCRLRILPHLRDEVKRLPEEGDSLRNRLCKLLTTPNTEVKRVVADLLYVLCKENVSRLIKYSGFGNAAGLLAQYGLMGGKSAPVGTYSDDSDSETEEYKELAPDVNPVTGRYEAARPDPMEGMTDEQKEHEAVKLINAMDKLQRIGIVQPSRIGPDGKPVAVESVLQLAEESTAESQTAADSDSD